MKYEVSNLNEAIHHGLSSKDFCSINGEHQQFINSALKDSLLADLRSYAGELTITKDLLQKIMQSQARLTNYLCHDFTNLLSVISFDASQLDGSCTKRERSQICENILVAAQLGVHVSKTITKLNAEATTSRISVVSWVLDNLSLMKSAAHNAELHTELFAQDCLIEVDERELLFCLLNLLINAREANFSRAPITVRTTCEFHKSRRVIIISVGGMGHGISRNARDLLSTTKGRDRGVGLLAVRSFCDRYNGDFVIEEKQGAGTVASIFLPVCDYAAMHA
jgi:signal transduction histidine kinase